MRQMTNDQSIGYTPVLVDDNEICHVVGPACSHQLIELIVAPVQTLRVGDQELELLGELFQSGRGVTGGCDHNFGVLHSGPSGKENRVLDKLVKRREKAIGYENSLPSV